MFNRLKSLLDKPPPAEVPITIGYPTKPPPTVKQLCWVIILKDDRVGYIHHYKTDGKFGVRPVHFKFGTHFPSPVAHWTEEERLKHPEELALTLRDFRPAEADEVPLIYQ